jgi:hypothetical protein
MKQKTLTLLFVATLVVGGVAALKLSRDEAAVASRTSNAELLPGLMKAINDVASITLQRKDGSATLVRDDSGAWGLSEKNGYPVESEAVHQSLIALAQMTPLEQKTDDPARYQKLGLQDPEAEGSTSTLVTVKDKSGKELAQLVVGKQSEGKGGMPSGNTYVRRAGEKVSWLAKGNPELKDKATDWLQKKVVEIKRDRLRSVEVRHADGEVVHVERSKPEDANFELSSIPEGQELSYPSVAGSITSALEYLNLEDVLPADKVDFAQGAGPTSEFRTFDGLKITVRVKEEGEKCYARFEAAYDAPPQIGPTPPAAPEAGADATKPPEPKADAQKKPEEVQKEADELQARLSKWVYQIPAYNKAYFTKHMKDMLKAKTPPAPPAGEAAPPPAGEKPVEEKPAEQKPAEEKPADEKPH